MEELERLKGQLISLMDSIPATGASVLTQRRTDGSGRAIERTFMPLETFSAIVLLSDEQTAGNASRLKAVAGRARELLEMAQWHDAPGRGRAKSHGNTAADRATAPRKKTRNSKGEI